MTPSSGETRAAFTVTFPAQPVSLGLQLDGPGRCATLDSLYISIRQAQTGRLRFGPGVPGARPRRDDGKRVKRWCRGVFHVQVFATGEFDPTQTDIVATGQFTVR